MKLRITIILGSIIIVAATLTTWARDTAPPFEILSVEPVTVAPGEVAELRAKVRRDLSRRCDVSFSRQLFTPAGYRIDLAGLQWLLADQLEVMDARAPGELLVTVEVPPGIKPGRAEVVTNLQYFCNPWHRWVRPISVTTVLPFEVTE